jgi:hypothetical protein
MRCPTQRAVLWIPFRKRGNQEQLVCSERGERLWEMEERQREMGKGQRLGEKEARGRWSWGDDGGREEVGGRWGWAQANRAGAGQ